MSMNFPWYRAWGRRTHSRGLHSYRQATGCSVSEPGHHLLPSARRAPRIQLPQAPREGLGNRQHSVLCPDGDLGTDSSLTCRPQEPTMGPLPAQHTCLPAPAPATMHPHSQRRLAHTAPGGSPDSLTLRAGQHRQPKIMQTPLTARAGGPVVSNSLGFYWPGGCWAKQTSGPGKNVPTS